MYVYRGLHLLYQDIIHYIIYSLFGLPEPITEKVKLGKCIFKYTENEPSQ